MPSPDIWWIRTRGEMDDPDGVPQLEAVQSHRKRALTGERGAQSGVSQRRRVVAVSPQYAYNKLLIRSESGGRHLSNGKRELGEIPSSVVLRLSARAEQGVCLSALDERVCLVLGRRRPSHPSVLDSVRRVLGDPPSFMLVDVTAPGFGSDDDTVLLVLPSHSATGPC